MILVGGSLALIGTLMEIERDGARQATEATPPATTVVDGHTTNESIDLIVRDRPTTGGRKMTALSPATRIEIVCSVEGELVKRDGHRERVWYKISRPADGWVSGAYASARADVEAC